MKFGFLVRGGWGTLSFAIVPAVLLGLGATSPTSHALGKGLKDVFKERFGRGTTGSTDSGGIKPPSTGGGGGSTPPTAGGGTGSQPGSGPITQPPQAIQLSGTLSPASSAAGSSPGPQSNNNPRLSGRGPASTGKVPSDSTLVIYQGQERCTNAWTSTTINSAGNWSYQFTGGITGTATPSATVEFWGQATDPTGKKTDCVKFGTYYYAKAPAPATPANPPVSGGGGTEGSSPRSIAKIFLSGHSLLDGLSSRLTPITQGTSVRSSYVDRHEGGSSIKRRIELGQLGELQNGSEFDTLLVTENHHLVRTLVNDDPRVIQNLRRLHDAFITGNKKNRTNRAAYSYFWHPWLFVDKDNPAPLIRYEKKAQKGWECVVERVNSSLEREGRSDRIENIPAGAALIHLLEKLLAKNVPGLPTSGDDNGELVYLLFDRGDEEWAPVVSNNYVEGYGPNAAVHPTDTAWYYLGLVAYAGVYKRSPTEVSYRPGGMSAAMADAFKKIAGDFIRDYERNFRRPTPEECTQVMLGNEGICITDKAVHMNFIRLRGQDDNCVNFFGSSSTNSFLFNSNANAESAFWNLP